MSAWAWLGDMELDDTLLGLGAAGIFQDCEPIALGFLVNAAHCAEKGGDGRMQASEMYGEKRAFLDAFFAGRFYAVLDRYAAGGKGRGWVGSLSTEELSGLGDACGLQDELSGWLEAIERQRPQTLHLLLSGPLLGRGEEICSALASRLLAPLDPGSGSGTAPSLYLWTYAGSFNLSHSSEQDRASLRKLVEDHAPRVAVVETTLKSGAWICSPPQPFWSSACPTAWPREDAIRNPIGFDASTDIQSANMFLQEYSSAAGVAGCTPRRGVQWIFQQIAAGSGAPDSPSDKGSVLELLRGLELRSLTTNLTKMVPPGSDSMAKVREALPVRQEELEVAYAEAVRCFKDMQAAATEGQQGGLDKFKLAAQQYAQLYRGSSGNFLEAGAAEYFPSEKPFSGPRLDKRCILRCMAEGKLQGGPTADLLIVLALLLFLPEMGGLSSDTEETTDAAIGCCSFVCAAPPSSAATAGSSPSTRLPAATRDLFRLHPGGVAQERVFSAVMRPHTEMDETCKDRLAPLVDAAIEALVLGGTKLQKASSSARWGPLHGPVGGGAEAK